jgi:hypothetical protein
MYRPNREQAHSYIALGEGYKLVHVKIFTHQTIAKFRNILKHPLRSDRDFLHLVRLASPLL